jgi:nicotinate phosphoribosyltransferase
MSTQLYGQSLSLLTDLYQLTMAYGYWKAGMADREAVFHLFFRRAPFSGQFAVACGLDDVIDFVRKFRFSPDDLDYLSQLRGSDERPLFEPAFLDYLAELTLNCSLDALREGTVVFAHEPLVRVQGPLLHSQLLETPLLNLINFQTLIATKAARVTLASGGKPILEFGLRRAQGVDGGVAASRAAFVGGCDATSNVLAGKLFGIPVKGTHAHSWVMAFDDEVSSFETYGDAMPHNTIFLVDTYETEQGVRNATRVGRRMREQGEEMLGIRLDSGDLGALSHTARQILDEEGFPDAVIVASSDLDEYSITELRQVEAPIDVWGVGTRLATAYDQPALGGVYKLAAIRGEDRSWKLRVKVSDQAAKTTTPGVLQVRRYGRDRFQCDVIYNELAGVSSDHAVGFGGQRLAIPQADYHDLLVPVFDGGKLVYPSESIHAAQRRTREQLDALPPRVKQLDQPKPYPVGLDSRLHRQKQQLIEEAKGKQR